MKTLKNFTNDEIEWLKENHDRVTIIDVIDSFEISREEVMGLMKELGLVFAPKKITKTDKSVGDLEIDQNYEYYMADDAKLRSKIARAKTVTIPGFKFRGYTVIAQYAHHCLVRDHLGFRECLTYTDIANMLK